MVFNHHIADDGDGSPRRGECRRSFGAFDGQLLAEDADLILGLGNRERDRLLPRRRNRLQAARACAAANPIDQIVRRTKLVLHDRSAEQRVVLRQRADRRRVSRVGRTRILHLLF